MTVKEATAREFWTAFRALSKTERGAVVEKLVADREFREDLVDIVLLEQRRREPSRPIEEYLAAKTRKAK